MMCCEAFRHWVEYNSSNNEPLLIYQDMPLEYQITSGEFTVCASYCIHIGTGRDFTAILWHSEQNRCVRWFGLIVL